MVYIYFLILTDDFQSYAKADQKKLRLSLPFYKNNMLKVLHCNLLVFEICALDINEVLVYKHTETIEYFQN